MNGKQCSLHTNRETPKVFTRSALRWLETVTNVVEKMTSFVILGSFGLPADRDHCVLGLARHVLHAPDTFARGERSPQRGATP
jgi:hypothetical protein